MDWSTLLWARLQTLRRYQRRSAYKAGMVWKVKAWDKPAVEHYLPIHLRNGLLERGARRQSR
jgi:hypothetical protein